MKVILNNQDRQEKAEFKKRDDFIPFNSIDRLVLEEFPDFLDYLFFHNVLDKLCWVIKLHYSDQNTVKKKRYRLDTLFQRFVVSNKIRSEKVLKCLSEKQDEEKIVFHLMKGWHNELVRSDPLHSDSLCIGTSINRWDGPGSGGMVGWNIIQSYYAFFEFVCCLGVLADPLLDTRGHKKVSRYFNNQLSGLGSGRFLFYPFTLNSCSSSDGFPVHPAFCQYQYASYPRRLGCNIFEIEEELPKAYKLLNADSVTSFVDLLYELRLWANYTGMQSLLKLYDGGYVQFLMRNLATIIYFTAGMAEVVAIFSLGEVKYLEALKYFSVNYIDKHKRFAQNKYLILPYIRLRSYKHLGLINSPIDFIMPSNGDPVEFISI